MTLITTVILYFMDFDVAFRKFHNIFFKIGTWQFPETSKLVTLFPREFWIDIVNKIMIKVVISANILILVGILILLVVKRRDLKNVIYKFQNIRTSNRRKRS